MTEKYAGWKTVYTTPFMDYAEDVFKQLEGNNLDLVLRGFRFVGFIGWEILSNPQCHEKAESAMQSIRAASKRCL